MRTRSPRTRKSGGSYRDQGNHRTLRGHETVGTSGSFRAFLFLPLYEKEVHPPLMRADIRSAPTKIPPWPSPREGIKRIDLQASLVEKRPAMLDKSTHLADEPKRMAGGIYMLVSNLLSALLIFACGSATSAWARCAHPGMRGVRGGPFVDFWGDHLGFAIAKVMSQPITCGTFWVTVPATRWGF